jgi:hypothetical protein
MCILKGFRTTLAKGSAIYFPFGLWFANPTTLYVADEGSGTNTYSSTTNTYTAAAASTTAGLERWVFNSSTNQWNLAYTLQNGLSLGVPYTPSGYPMGNNTGSGGTNLPWAPATDGLRNLTGQVNGNGTVTIRAATSTVSGSGDQGADPTSWCRSRPALRHDAPADRELRKRHASHERRRDTRCLLHSGHRCRRRSDPPGDPLGAPDPAVGSGRRGHPCLAAQSPEAPSGHLGSRWSN